MCAQTPALTALSDLSTPTAPATLRRRHHHPRLAALGSGAQTPSTPSTPTAPTAPLTALCPPTLRHRLHSSTWPPLVRSLPLFLPGCPWFGSI